MNDRLTRCRALLEELKLDGVIVSDPTDVRYLSGFRGEDTTLLVGRDAALLCTDSRFWEQVHEEVDGFELVRAQGADLLADTAAAAAERLGPAAALGFQ
ncbi:MAG: aminopeptidase P family N-terminal domain-containing protein, partial [Thermoleophilia bacterium]